MIPAQAIAPRGSRQSDEATLEMIARRTRGESLAQVGRALGLSAGFVAIRTNEVLAADLAHPDPSARPAQIRRAYW